MSCTRDMDEREQSSKAPRHMRLPQALIDDCKQQAESDEGWQDVLRRIADEAARYRRKVRPGPGRMPRTCVTLEEKTIEYLDGEAKRLTDETGKYWTAAGVLRALWTAAKKRQG